MTHSFLVESGSWQLQGVWIERDRQPKPVQGMTIIAWTQADWFTMVTKLVFPQEERPEISFQYRGRLDLQRQQYTFVLRQTILGKIEGEGWLASQSIIQRYWVLGDGQRRSGFDTFYQLDQDSYHLSSAILTGHYLTSAMEARLNRKG
ncbi:MAG: hypothetical protein HC890_05775 [Chloroflexaceae bacterium]|nr:hypothetical protein [Chloroflexaceae bacterium]